MNATFERLRKIQHMLDEKEYLNQADHLPKWRKVTNFCILVFKSFQKNRGPVRAAALAYTTVLALVPILAVVVSISTGFLQKDQGQIIDKLLGHFVATIAPQLDLKSTDEEQAAIGRATVVARIRGYIDTVNSGALGLTAGLALVFIAVTVLSSVETTFNDIWGVTRGRTWSARIVQYWAAITLGPIFIVTSMALTTTAQLVSTAKEDSAKVSATNAAPATNLYVGTNSILSSNTPAATNAASVGPAKPSEPTFMQKVVEWSLRAPVLSTLLGYFGRFVLPFVVLSVFLMLFYKLMPATRVLWRAAAVGGLVGGGLLQLNNLFNVVYISKVTSYSKIYGGLGAVPIFLVGLYFSWIIILLGAQVAYAFQNRRAYVQERETENVHQRGREFAGLRIMAYVAQSFYLGQTPPSRMRMCSALGIPSQLGAQVLSCLAATKLLLEVVGEETGYSPGRPIDKISIDDILAALRAQGTDLSTSDDPTRAILIAEFERIRGAEMQAAGAVSLQTIVQRMAALPSAKTAG